MSNLIISQNKSIIIGFIIVLIVFVWVKYFDGGDILSEAFFSFSNYFGGKLFSIIPSLK